MLLKNKQVKGFNKIRNALKKLVIEYVDHRNNFLETIKVSNLFCSEIFKKLNSRKQIAEICIKAFNKSKNFVMSFISEEMIDYFLSEELFYFRNSELLNSWGEPLFFIFSDINNKTCKTCLKIEIEEFLQNFRHLECLLLKFLRIFWTKNNNTARFDEIFYFEKKFDFNKFSSNDF